LHLAVEDGKFEVVRLLLEDGAGVHIRNKNCQTPFDIGSEKGKRDIMALLHKHMLHERLRPEGSFRRRLSMS
jgi:ankyrin repeat protein